MTLHEIAQTADEKDLGITIVLNALENHHFMLEELYMCALSAVYLSSVFGG